MNMARRTAYEEQLAAMEGVFGAQRAEAKADIAQEDIDAWGSLAEGYGISGSNITRLKKLIAGEYATRLGGISSNERMFFANIRRAEEERKRAGTRNLATTIGTAAGIVPSIFAPELAPIFMGAGGSLGSLIGGFIAGEQDPNTAAGMVGAADAYGSYQFRREIKALTDSVARLYGGADGWGQVEPYEGESIWDNPPEIRPPKA